MVKIKIACNSELRRYDVPEGKIFETLIALIRSEFKLESFRLLYQDDDKDWITITNESDAQEAINVAEKVGQTLKVCVKTEAVAPPAAPASAAPPSDDAYAWVKFPAQELEAEDRASQVEERKMNVDAEAVKPAPGPLSGLTSVAAEPAGVSPAMDWVAMCEDLLASKEFQSAQQKLLDLVFAGVAQGRKVSELIIQGIKDSSFRDHPFVKEGLDQMQTLLQRADAFGFVLLKAGRPGVEMALPSVMRGFAKFMQSGQSAPVLVDLADVFKQLFPQWFHMLQMMVPKGQTMDLNIGKILAMMGGMGGAGAMMGGGGAPAAAAAPSRPGEPSMSESAPAAGPFGAPAEDPEVQAAAKEGIVIHKGITCDICNTGPIIGVRYKCLSCSDYDMCEECAAKKEHNPDHPLLKLAKPMPRGGFCVGRDRLPGAAEMFTPPWMRHKRRAMKKFFKAMKKHGGQGDEPEGKEEDETRGEHCGWRRGHWGRGRGRGRRGNCHRGGPGRWFAEMWQQGAPGAAAGTVPPEDLMALDTPSSGTSSSESSSSDSEMEGAEPGVTERASKKKALKLSKKKLKKKHKKLVVRAKKVTKKVAYLKKQKSKIEKKLDKSLKKERKTINELRLMKFELEKSEEAQRKQKEIRSSKKKQAKKAGFTMFQESVRASKSPRSPDGAPTSSEPQLESVGTAAVRDHEPEEMKIDPTTEPDKTAKFEKQLQLLREMGFSDDTLNFRLLEENEGDLKNVVVVLATATAIDGGGSNL